MIHPTNCNCPHHFADAGKKIDPTGTGSIRKAFESDLVRRFKQLRRLILESVGTNDALGLAPKLQIRLGDAAIPKNQYAFARSDQKVELFMGWLREQQNQGILEIQPGVSAERAANDAWTSTYIETAYRKGVRDAGAKLAREGADVSASWVQGFFNRPIHADRLGLLYTRTFSDLKGITEAMDTQISRVLAEGIASGKGPLQVAREMANRVDNVGITRARVIARTEIVKAHAQATLNSYREAGIEGVEVEAEFTTAGDDAVCAECDALSGKTYPVGEAQSLIPVHPNCLPGDSLVLSRSGISAATKREFNGDLIVIKTASGRSLSCTPNHPILTDCGWAPAQLLNLESKVICDGGSEWESAAYGNNDNVISSIHDVAESFLGSCEVTTMPVPTTTEHFHGDGIDGQIAIVGTNRSLLVAPEPTSPKGIVNGHLKIGAGRLGSLLSFCSVTKVGFRSFCSTHSIMRALNLVSSLFVSHLRPAQRLGLGLGSGSYARLNQKTLDGLSVKPKTIRYGFARLASKIPGCNLLFPHIGKLASGFVFVAKQSHDNLGGDAVLAAKLINGESCQVFADKVVFVDRFVFSGHVYNLETGEGWYSANGIVTHNCRCAWNPKVINGTGIELK